MSIRIESLSGPSEAERQCVRRILQRYNLAHFETTDEQEFTIVARDDELTACGPLPLEPETVADASAASVLLPEKAPQFRRFRLADTSATLILL